MGIVSETFSSVRLSGKDAEQFVEQVKNGRPIEAVAKSAARGRSMVEAMRRDGQVFVQPKGVHREE